MRQTIFILILHGIYNSDEHDDHEPVHCSGVGGIHRSYERQQAVHQHRNLREVPGPVGHLRPEVEPQPHEPNPVVG